ncbi:hypothetical protein HNP99_002982 [Flavobacterium sp. 28A]|nr:hypothetical protein [Flavobacterium sp. 28A]
MKIFKYILIRILVLIGFLTLLWNNSYYLLPESLQEGKFSFFSEAVVFLRISLLFVFLFLCYTLYELNNYHKNSQYQLRNIAIVFNLTLILIATPLIIYNIKY